MKLNLSETAIKNREKLFPGQKSFLQNTDPELAEVFDNFAFGEVFSYGNLDIKTRVMMILASTIGSQALSHYKIMFEAAINVGITPLELKEVLIQSVPYVGMSKAIDFINATNHLLESKGIKLPLECQSTTAPESRYEKGLHVQKEIFGAAIEKMYKESPPSQLHI
jgi:4-carboxymuconolactone decarboxylase